MNIDDAAPWDEMPASKSQLKKLSKRLVDGEMSDEDALLLDEFYDCVGAFADEVADRIESVVEQRPTLRLKDPLVLRAKLERTPGYHIHTIDDVAGVRLTLKDLDESNRCQAAVRESLEMLGQVKEIDRRADPRHGYRAMHLVVTSRQSGLKVEVQLRTQLEHRWAEVFEQYAELAGRGVRYGEDPVLPDGLDPARGGVNLQEYLTRTRDILLSLSDIVGDTQARRREVEDVDAERRDAARATRKRQVAHPRRWVQFRLLHVRVARLSMRVRRDEKRLLQMLDSTDQGIRALREALDALRNHV